jgi:hypothetical protein
MEVNLLYYKGLFLPLGKPFQTDFMMQDAINMRD